MARWLLSLADPWSGAPEELPMLLGRKGVSLRQLHALGYDVPPAFTITTEAVREYLKSEGEWPSGLREEVAAELSRLEAAVGLRWGGGPLPLTVAVRSGAAASHPGLMRTVLFCGWTERLAAACESELGWREFARFLAGLLSPDPLSPALPVDRPAGAEWRGVAAELLRRVRQTFGDVPDDPTAWLWRAIDVVAASAVQVASTADRASVELDLAGDDIDPAASARAATAITVQAMFRSEVSGVLCSHDPLAPESGRIVLEMTPGDGLALMSGRIQPTARHLPRDAADGPRPGSEPPRSVVGERTLLTVSQESRLRSAALDLEQRLGGPVEVEWGAAGDRLVLFQCRPAAMAAAPVREEIERLRTWAAQGRRLWVRHPVGEELGTPTPLTWSLWQRFLSPDGGWGELYRHLGYAPRVHPDGAGCFALIAGRVYVDPDRWVQLICRSYPWRHHPAELRQRPELLLEPPTQLDPQRLDPWFLFTWPQLVWVLARAGWRKRRLCRSAAADFALRTVPQFRQELDRWRTDLRSSCCPWLERLSQAERLRQWLFEDQAPRLLLPGWLGVQAWQEVTAALRRRLGPSPAEEIAVRLLTAIDRGGGPVDAPGDVDSPGRVGTPATSWELHHPGPPQLGDGDDCGSLPQAAGRPWLDGHLPTAAREALGRRLETELQTAVSLLPLREQGRRCLLAGYDLLRGLLAELAESSGLGEELYFLEWDELLRLPRSPVTPEVLARRRGAWRYWRRHPPPPVIDGGATAPFEAVSLTASGSEWPVTALATGDGEGPVWRPSAASDPCPRGAVVVTETADSAAVLRWKGAAAIVVEQGGRLSHAAVTARQIGLPLVVLPGGVWSLPTGSRVRVEADSGRLWVVTEAVPTRPG